MNRMVPDVVVCEFLDALDAYVEAKAPPNSHAMPRQLKHDDPVVLRFREARVRLNTALLNADRAFRVKDLDNDFLKDVLTDLRAYNSMSPPTEVRMVHGVQQPLDSAGRARADNNMICAIRYGLTKAMEKRRG